MGSTLAGHEEQHDLLNMSSHSRTLEKAHIKAIRNVVAERLTRPIPAFRRWLFLALWVCCVAFWIQGAFILPTLEIHIMPGTPFQSFYRRSLVLTLVDLYKKKTYFAWAILTTCSVCIPSVKLASTLFLILQLFCNPPADVYMEYRRLISALSMIASYQLVDMYVGVLFIVHFSSDSADAKFLQGFYWYYTYCMLSMLMSAGLDMTFSEAEAMSMHTQDDSPQSPRSSSNSRQCQDQSPTGSRQKGNAIFKISEYITGFHRHWSGEEAQEQERKVLEFQLASERAADQVDRTGGFRLPEFVDSLGVLITACSFVYLLGWCYTSPVLEMRTVWKGVSVDRSIHAISEIFCSILLDAGGMYVAGPLFLMNLVFPIVYTAALLAVSVAYLMRSSDHEWKTDAMVIARTCCYCADVLRPWATTDVFCFATLVFVFTVQDGATLTMPLADSNQFYYWLGVGFGLFYLRWCTESRGYGITRWLPAPRCWTVLICCVCVCCFVFGGWCRLALDLEGQKHFNSPGAPVPGATKHYHFKDLDSVCANARPVVQETLRSALPNSYGMCNSKNSSENPPSPCNGHKDLYTKEDAEDQYIIAKWISGVNSIRFSECNLFKMTPDPFAPISSNSTYQLTLGGVFDEIKLFLHARQCEDALAFLGCTKMNSADHCCGSDIRFNVTFELGCKEGLGFSDVKLVGMKLDPLWVGANFLDGQLKLEALDIGPKVEDLMQNSFTGWLADARLDWAGKKMKIPDLINDLIKYNSPGHRMSC